VKKPSSALLALLLGGLVLVMFSFAYANVPLFKLFCQRFGLDGSGKAGITGGAPPPPSSTTGDVLDRTIQVKFMGITGTGLPVQFAPSIPLLQVHPGKPVQIEYSFTNMSDDSVYFRAVHSIMPQPAAREFQLMECFCFTDQTLAPRESRRMPVLFALSPRTPTNVNEVILSYTLFPRDPNRKLPVPAKAAN
jgi:cytochrome c oxidase assembly protein subunit 11